MKYNKAIRDKIPDIIKNSGDSCAVKTLDDTEFLEQLEKKLTEEVNEYLKNHNSTELVDILEVIYRIAELREITLGELEKIRLKKLEERGGFKKNLFLIDTRD